MNAIHSLPLAVLVGCAAAPTPTQYSPRDSMSADDARRVIAEYRFPADCCRWVTLGLPKGALAAEGVNDAWSSGPHGGLPIAGITTSEDRLVVKTKAFQGQLQGQSSAKSITKTFLLEELVLPPVRFTESNWGYTDAWISIKRGWTIYDGANRDASNPQRLADALYVLKQGAIKKESEMDARVAASVNRGAPSSEYLRRVQIQAASAVKAKRFDDAIDLFGRALDSEPAWADGHYNRAVILAETGSYGMAVREMKRYLKLRPDAADARALQDQIYAWEAKAKY